MLGSLAAFWYPTIDNHGHKDHMNHLWSSARTVLYNRHSMLRRLDRFKSYKWDGHYSLGNNISCIAEICTIGVPEDEATIRQSLSRILSLIASWIWLTVPPIEWHRQIEAMASGGILVVAIWLSYSLTIHLIFINKLWWLLLVKIYVEPKARRDPSRRRGRQRVRAQRRRGSGAPQSRRRST